MDDRAHFAERRDAEEDARVRACDRARKQRQREEFARLEHLGALAARKLGPLADGRTCALVSGLSHDAFRRSRFIIVHGADGACAAVEATQANRDRAQRAQESGVVESWESAEEFYRRLEEGR